MGKDKGKPKEAALSWLQWWGQCRNQEGHGELLTQDLHSVALHSLPVLAGHDAAVGARVLLLGIQDLQPVATWAKGGS